MRPRLLLLALLVVGCTPKPRYQGDKVIGNFLFTATPPNPPTCELQPSDAGPFQFAGVFSYDSRKQVLYLDTDGDTSDDHTGSLSGAHFVLHGSADRDLGCGVPVTIDEILEGDLYPQLDGGCAAVQGDGGGSNVIGDGGVDSLVEAALACGRLTDTPRPLAADSGATCQLCTIEYTLTAVHQ